LIPRTSNIRGNAIVCTSLISPTRSGNPTLAEQHAGAGTNLTLMDSFRYLRSRNGPQGGHRGGRKDITAALHGIALHGMATTIQTDSQTDSLTLSSLVAASMLIGQYNRYHGVWRGLDWPGLD
jgi:hypothetical protein